MTNHNQKFAAIYALITTVTILTFIPGIMTASFA